MMDYNQKISFSGHESFICKQFWLKKVFDFTSSDFSFNDENSVVELGVGKNMVSSLRYWGKAFSIIDENDKQTEIAQYLLDNKGKDPYIEDIATIWLLHYLLIINNKFSITNLIFNQFRKERVEFTKEQLLNFLIRKTREYQSNTDNTNTIEREINVFLRKYSKPEKGDSIEVEDDFSSILIDLDLLKRFKQRGLDGKVVDWYKIEANERTDIPYQVILFSILDNYPDQSSITFRELLIGMNSPGCIFTLNPDGLHHKLQEISENHKSVVYSETAGNQVLQIKSKINKYSVLNDYYKN